MSAVMIRPYQPTDRPSLTAICVKTAASGKGAEGVLRDDAMWGDVFAVPYADHDPSLAFVIDVDGEARGYVLATADTEAFSAWFRNTWWPGVRERYAAPGAGEKDAWLLTLADGIGAEASPYAERFPAHLHIDLLPDVQGGGNGRRLIETILNALRDRGVAGVHLVANSDNLGARAFYDRLGFTRLAADEGSAAFGMSL